MKPIPECKQCGECCKYFVIRRIVKTKLLEEYATARGYTFFGNQLLIPSVCPHLTEDNKCDIYETRPVICRDYHGFTGKANHYYVPPGCVYGK